MRKGVETEGLEEHDDGGVYEEELERETIRKTKKTKEAVYEGQDEEAGKDEDEEDKESSCQERLWNGKEKKKKKAWLKKKDAAEEK